jgi:signal transduction histidine kinase
MRVEPPRLFRGRLGVAVLTALVAGVLLAMSGLLAAQRFDRLLVETIVADIERDRRSLLAGVDRFRIVAVVDAVDQRIVGHADAGRPGIYLVAAVDGSLVTGNLAAWPEALPRTDGLHQLVLLDGPLGGRALVRVERVAGNWWLAVGRSTAAWDAFRGEAALLLAGVAGLVLLAAIAIAHLAGRREARDVAAMRAALGRFRGGDLASRLGVGQRDPGLLALAEGVDATLAHVERLLGGMNRLSATVAHELKSPLSRVRYLLARGDVARAETELEAASGLVDGLLDIAANEAGLLSGAKPCDLADVVRDVAAVYADAADAAGLQLKVAAAPAPALADADLVARALANLIDNALRHAVRGGVVRVATGMAGDRAFARVTDCGTGPPATSLADLIARARPGVRADGTRSSGLGLRLVQAIALRHGAEVTVAGASPGHAITLTFPPAPAM